MFLENIKEAFSNLSSNKMRSFLTMLGIIIGITAVITITTIGNSIRSTLNATMNSLGGNSIYAYLEPEYPENDADWENWEYPEMEDSDYITLDNLYDLKDTYPNEIAGFSVSAYVGGGQVFLSSDHYANVSVEGITESQLDFMHIKMAQGRNITPDDIRKELRVCLVSDTMANYYFAGKNPIGQQVTVNVTDGNSYTFTIVGVYEYSDAAFGKIDTSVPEKDRFTSLYIPVTTALNYSEQKVPGYDYVSIMLQVGTDATTAQADIEDYFNNNLYADNDTWHIYCYNASSEMETIDTVINAITLAISFIAAISLIVGGVGVMNIMLVSITERTKEIGIRKALGAKNRAIKQQFLIESVVLCLTGGIIGILFGLLLGWGLGKVATMVINTYFEDMAGFIIMNVRPSILAIVLSVGFSMLIGVFFGSYPAKKAAEMEVIDALRYE